MYMCFIGHGNKENSSGVTSRNRVDARSSVGGSVGGDAVEEAYIAASNGVTTNTARRRQ